MKNIVHNCDNMKFMKDIPDNHYDLAIVDPPYGIGAGKRRADTGKNKHIKQNDYKYGNWDNSIPDKKYFDELFRISKNQIIWGGNYFIEFLKNTSCVIVWNKKNGENLYADCELAWTSFDTAVRMFEYRWFGFLQEKHGDKKEKRIHPTQKPVALYKWLLKNYAKPGQTIFDSHVGSGSIRIACHDLGFDFEGCELDQDYWQTQEERYKNHTAQQDLFEPEEYQELIFDQEIL